MLDLEPPPATGKPITHLRSQDREGSNAFEHPPSGWPRLPHRHKAAAVWLGAAIHAGLLIALLKAHLEVPAPAEQATVWTNLVPMSPPRSQSVLPRISGAVPRPLFVPKSNEPLHPSTPAAAWVATAPASAASAPRPDAPLRLTLTPGELRAIEAGSPPTLAQRLARPPAASPLAQALAPTPQFEEDDRGGMHTVRSHGGCFILVPSGQAKADPFNHGGERLSGRATNDNC